MAAIPNELLEAAGFTGASAAQGITSAQNKAAINTNQNTLGGVQERRGITDSAESRGMLRSSMTNTQLGEQTAEQNNQQQLIDQGLSDSVTGQNINVMQELAQQQAQEEAAAYQREQFDAEMILKRKEMEAKYPNSGINWNAVGNLTGGRVTGTGSTGNWNGRAQ